MKLLVVGANSPTGKSLTEILRKRKIRFHAPADKHFDLKDPAAMARLIAESAPTQLVNLTDFISSNHSALRRAETAYTRCNRINAELPTALSQVCAQQGIPLLHLSNSYVFDGEKRLGYNENDEPRPLGVYGRASLEGENAVRAWEKHIIVRSGWLFGKFKKGLIKSWIRAAKKHHGQIDVVRRHVSPTPTEDMASAIMAICLQVDCDANAWGTYHYSGLGTKREKELAEQTLKYAANHDEEIYQLLDSVRFTEHEAVAPELRNATLSSKKIFDTFAIKQKSWHGDLQEAIKTLYGDRPRPAPEAVDKNVTTTNAASAPA